KVSKPGFDADQTNDPQQLIFSSDWLVFKQIDDLSRSFTKDAGAGGSIQEFRVAHNLGYPPFVRSFWTVDGGDSWYLDQGEIYKWDDNGSNWYNLSVQVSVTDT